MASKLLWTFYGPRLLRIFKTENAQGHDYVPGVLESFPDKIISTFNTALGVSYWTSPVIGAILYRKGYFTQEGAGSLLRVALSMFVVYAIAYILRGIGRFSNAEYRDFISALVAAREKPTVDSKKQLAGYDFEFWAWPVDFRWDDGSSSDKKNAKKPAVVNSRRAQAVERSSIPCRFLSYLAMHSFGRRMVYPGATSLMNYAVSSMLNSGRAALVEEKNGHRAKVLAEGGNEIDTMFVDRRGKHNNGKTLVIAFEGNAGFYELGCTGTPLDLNYSVLGWNHPGFGGSTGVPFPDQEQKAVDAVIQYAIQKLGFEPQDIALFAWSIGGYTASWAARNYPDIKYVILDATFDDIVPLAIAKMPESWKSLVGLSLRTYMDLNVAEQLLDYKGPVLLVRRTKDEIISTEAPPNSEPVIGSNRGNFLLLKLLQHRYPSLVDSTTLPMINEFLAAETYRQAEMLQERLVVPEECHKVFSQHVAESGTNFPMALDVKGDEGLKIKLALYLVTVHMENFHSTHCTPLPGNFFHEPWVPQSRL
ncbi:phosphatidylserine lipase ABHD16A [Aplysia californica]|uniref:Phosphatidylserine lipase ABHD16A n=1 Tax=Aplysia californica TaxID=6500 RepID=A0ABM0JXI1_APLCA|nr:phosphatidylserine lipase ABHD16A [Aplysia californica]